MWDAWAAYDPVADGYFVRREARGRTTSGPRARRRSATPPTGSSCTATRWPPGLAGRPSTSSTSTMESLCYRIDYATRTGDSPAALGNRIAAAVIAYGRTTARTSSAVRRSGLQAGQRAAGRQGAGHRRCATRTAGSRSRSTQIVAQNGVPIPGKVQRFVGSHWGHVTRLRASRGARRDCRSTPGPPPPSYGDAGVQARPRSRSSRYSSQLDPATAPRSTSARARAAATRSATNDGDGHGVNPVTGQPTRRTSSRAATSRARWPSSGPTARSRRRRPATGTRSRTRSSDSPGSSSGSAARARARPARVGRQALLRAQRRRARRRRRRVGREAPLRLGAADLDDPLHGRQGQSSIRAARYDPTASLGLVEVVTRRRARRASATRTLRRPRGRDRDPRLAGQPGGPGDRASGRRLDPRGRLGARTSGRRSSRRRSPATSRATARSAARRPR